MLLVATFNEKRDKFLWLKMTKRFDRLLKMAKRVCSVRK